MKEQDIDNIAWAYEEGFKAAIDCLNSCKDSVSKETMKKKFLKMLEEKH